MYYNSNEQLLTPVRFGRYYMESKHCKPAFERADPDRRNKVIQTAVDEFSGLGFENANINVIAKKAGISIGLMYKYFETKEDLFILCLEEAISELHAVIEAVLQSDDKILVRAEKLIRAIQQTSGRESRYVKLYNEITKMSDGKQVRYYADRIEGISYEAYAGFLKRAKEEGDIRSDLDERMFAFFFDSLLMTLQFSYTCDYYRERFKVYCGDDIFDNDEKVVRELLKFLESAFTFSHDDVKKLEKSD